LIRVSTPIEDLRTAVEAAAAELGNGATTAPTLERPKKAGFGDYSTNAAMLLAPKLGAPPREIAERLGESLRERLGARVEKVEVAGPGFLNVFLSDAWYAAAAAHMLAAEDWGAGTAAERERIVIEFVSANPTGPVTAASGRHAAYGDALARLLEFAGHDVSREYYFNDAGGQLLRLGESIRARARGEAVPEDGYQGEYVAELAAEIPNAAERDAEDLAFAGGQLMIERIKASLERFGVTYDTWFSERTLHEDGEIERAIERVEKAGYAYRSEGALWLRTSDFGDSQDQVIVRSNGIPTYFAADVAYVENKVERGFERQITPLGADHHGYVPRFKAALAVLGGDPDRLEVPLLQFVHVVERGERASMSKRRGEFITLDELVDQIGVDVTRYFLLQRSHDSTIDLDLDLAVKEEPENPVYYVQYAHARTANILRKVGEERVGEALGWTGLVDHHPSERELVLKLLAFPDEAAEAAERRAPHRIAVYALELGRALAAFYRDCPVLRAETEDLKSFRVQLTIVTKRVLARSLGLLGVSAPESM
jgi:arginyl-tRNA synthetase